MNIENITEIKDFVSEVINTVSENNERLQRMENSLSILEKRINRTDDKKQLVQNPSLFEKEEIADILKTKEDVLEVISYSTKPTLCSKKLIKIFSMLSKRFLDSKEIILEAVKNDGYALEYASELLKNDKDVVLEAVKNKGQALEYASKSLKNDKEIILEAIKNSGYALRYVPESMKNDKEIILAAVKNDGWALLYASESLRDDKEFILMAVKTKLTCVIGIKIPLGDNIIAYLSEKLSDKEYIKKVSYDEDHENDHLITCHDYLEEYSTVPAALKEFIDSL